MRKKFSLVVVIALAAALLSAPSTYASAIVVTFPTTDTGFTASADKTGFVSVATATGVTPAISGGTAGSMRVVVSATNSGLLRITTTTGVTASSGYTLANFSSGSDGLSTISFDGDVDKVSVALGSLEFRKVENGTSNISVQVSQGSGLVYDNRYYEVISASLDWETAFKTALTKSVPASDGQLACQGYLVTVTSAEEQAFVYEKVKTETWIALSDDTTYVNAAITAYNAATDPDTTATSGEGKFFWVSGPERGRQVTTGNYSGGQTPLVEGAYANWNGSEPNNSSSNENATQFISNGKWNDLPHTGTTRPTYVVEYGGIRVTAGHQTDVNSVVITNANHIGTKAACIPAAAASAVTKSFNAVVATVPGRPTNLTATGGTQSASLSWTAPASTGGSAITGYKIESAKDGAAYVTAVANTGSTATTATVSNLIVGSSYQFRVSAINIMGASIPSDDSVSVTISANLPSAPSGISVSYPGNSAPIAISWDAPANNGGSSITSYVVEYQNGGSWIPLTASGQTSSISTSLVNLNTRWLLRVAAVNVAGQGPWATWGNEPPAPYSGPVFTGIGTGGNISAGKNSSITLTGSNLSMISEMFVGTTKLTFTRNGDQLVANLPALTAGTYDLRVVFTGGGVLIHQSALRVTEQVARVNVGSFNGRLVLYVANKAGSNIAWRVGGKWGKAVADTEFFRIDRPTPRRGASVKVELYVDGKLELTRTVVTR